MFEFHILSFIFGAVAGTMFVAALIFFSMLIASLRSMKKDATEEAMESSPFEAA